MAVVVNPLMSSEAHGRVGGLVYKSDGQRSIANLYRSTGKERKEPLPLMYPKPKVVKEILPMSHRLWRNLTSSQLRMIEQAYDVRHVRFQDFARHAAPAIYVGLPLGTIIATAPYSTPAARSFPPTPWVNRNEAQRSMQIGIEVPLYEWEWLCFYCSLRQRRDIPRTPSGSCRAIIYPGELISAIFDDPCPTGKLDAIVRIRDVKHGVTIVGNPFWVTW